MAASLPGQERRRPRRGSIERPINSRMYRGTWLLVGLPLLVAAFSVARPQPLPAPAAPPTFDADAALTLATSLAADYGNRAPGAGGALGALTWVAERFQLYGFEVRAQTFDAEIPGRGSAALTNLYAVAPGPSPESPVLVVMAHRDNGGLGRGANDNASGTAALVELARPYARLPSSSGGAVSPAHTIVFLSTDGGAFGGLGAAHFARHSPYADAITAVINLDTIAGPGVPRIELAADTPRSTSATLVQTAAERLVEQTGMEPERPGALRQLADLGFPFSLHEHAPFVARGIPAVTLTTAGPRPLPPLEDSTDALDAERLGEVGAAAQQLLGSLDQGLELPAGGATFVWLGPRVVRGWAIQLVLLGALLPFLAAAVDLFARCRRRRIPLAPALRSYRSRLGFWLFVGALFAASALLGAWPRGAARPPAAEVATGADWPVVALTVLLVLSVLGWLVARDRLLPRRPVAPAEELAGYAGALLALGLVSLVVAAINPFALLFVLPSLHAWLWLPQVRDAHVLVRLGVLALGFAGPALLVLSFASRLGLGVDALWYLAALVSLRYVDVALVVVMLAWLAVAGQLGALSVRRYAPYPEADERPPRGPLRELVRHVVLAARARRAAPEEDARAFGP
ncbi:MAG TPA: M28 family peptidase [Gaiellaceae bacterium]|nr:M28 family peptidase [Gaiellaceae bacterium]